MQSWSTDPQKQRATRRKQFHSNMAASRPSENVVLCLCTALLMLFTRHHLALAEDDDQIQKKCPDPCVCDTGRVACESEFGIQPLRHVPPGIPNDTNTLFLEYNEIGSIGLELHSLPLLQTLDLSSNEIENIDKDAFSGLEALVSLVLGKNRLTIGEISGPLFRDLGNLVFLDLSSNRLGPSLPGSLFLPLRRLKTLLLEGNHIVTISPAAFLGMGVLETMVLRDNDLRDVPTEALQHLSTLDELDLSNNNISTVEGHAFRGLASLRLLYLMDEAHLQTIKNFAFSDAVTLEVINLEKSPVLTSIERRAFHGVLRLSHVNLQENGLSILHEDLLPWQQLDAVYLFGNPWRCDCHIAWMAELLRTKEQQHFTETTCGSPGQLAGQALEDIPREYFTCPDDDHDPSVLIFRVVPVVAVTCFVTFAMTLLGIKLWQRFRRPGLLSGETVSYGGLGNERQQPEQSYGSVTGNSARVPVPQKD